MKPLAVFALLLLASCADFGDPTVVTVGSDEFTLDDLRRHYADLPPSERPRLDTREGRVDFVDRVVERHLLALDGAGVAEQDPEALQSLEWDRRGILVRRLITLEGGSPDPGEEQIAEAYERTAARHRIERALFAHSASAESARARIASGGDFERAVAAAGGVSAGGAEWVEWSPFPDPVLDAVARLEVGEVSAPVEVAGRHFLVWVLERQPHEVPPLDEARSMITRGLRVRAQNVRVEALSRRLRADARVRLRPEGVDLLVQRTADAILAPGVTEHDRDWAVPRLRAGEEEVVVAEWGSGMRWTAADYRDELSRSISTRRPRVDLQAAVPERCLQGVTAELFLAEAKRRSLETDWWAMGALRRLQEDRFVQLAVGQIDEGIAVDPDFADSVAARIWNAQPNLSQRVARARVLRMEFPTREAALAERERILRAGGARPRLEELLLRERQIPLSYHVTSFSPGGLGAPEIEAVVFGEGPGVLTGPHEFAGRWMLAECLDVEPERDLSDEEMLADIRERTQRTVDASTIRRWANARREELGFSVNEDALEALAPGA